MKNYLPGLASTIFLFVTLHAQADEMAPMFGGTDRSADPELAQKDALFIAQATDTFGTREHASIGYVDSGFEAHLKDKDQLAMQRFNEAWLLNPDNPYVYVGFGVLYQKQQRYCEAMDMFQAAEDRQLDKAGFLADYGLLVQQCAQTKDADEKTTLTEKANTIFAQAEQTPNPRILGYVYQSWARAALLQDDLEMARQMLDEALALDAKVDAELRQAISGQAP